MYGENRFMHFWVDILIVLYICDHVRGNQRYVENIFLPFLLDFAVSLPDAPLSSVARLRYGCFYNLF